MSASQGWFEEEVVGLLPDLFGAALRLERNRADAEDLVAETVSKAWTARDSLADQSKVRGWLFRIMTNTFISARRATSRQAADESLDEDSDRFSLFDPLHAPVLLWWGSPEQEFLDKLLRDDLSRAVAALPERYRVVVVLADVQGFSYQEIAETLEIPVGTVRSRLARARGKLQKALWTHAQDSGLVPVNRRTDKEET